MNAFFLFKINIYNPIMSLWQQQKEINALQYIQKP